MFLDTYSFVLQISRQKLLNYILENVTIGNLPAVPQFLFKASDQKGTIKAIVDDVQLTLQKGTDQATLTYHIRAATIALASKPQLGFSDGEIAIALKITAGQPFKILLKSASFTTTQTSNISDTTSFFADVSSIVTGALNTSAEFDIFPNTPSSSALILLGLMLNGRIFCLDADTLCAVIGQGDPSKVDNILKKHDFGIGLAASWVKTNLLFPAEAQLLNPVEVAALLSITVPQAVAAIAAPTVNFLSSVKPLLPPPFGSGEAKQTAQGVDSFFTFIDFTLTNGSIDMTARFRGEAFCAHISKGVVNESVSLAIVNQAVVATFSPNPPKPTYSVEFDFWCSLGFLFLAGNVALVTGIVTTAIAVAVVTSMDIQQKGLSTNPFAIPAFDQVTWTDLDIFSFGLVLHGKSGAVVGYSSLESRIDISATTNPINEEDVGPGTYHFLGNLVCKAQTFQYEQFRRDLVIALVPIDEGLLYPVTTTWKVHAQTITGSSGHIAYVDTAYTSVPPFDGTALVNHQIGIDYKVNPNSTIYQNYYGFDTLELTIPKSNYNFGLFVELAVQDASGHIFNNQLFLDVQTDIVRFGQDYDDFVKKCALGGKLKLSKLKTIPKKVLNGGDPLTPVEMTKIVSEVVSENPSQALEVVKAIGQIHGGAVMKAFAPKVKVKAQPG